ncbi:3-hydroxyacyl-[acyl-carrier-protein] dehydratase [Chitinophaga sp. CF118]|uniref:3-hydroxyacyl-ACP dehydratase FabZ family protein n=1 Tax=Chitinophaga sp. CF118 TaxID=1884367 RepID=UPI0008F05CC0|nr:3-hydroxyacyl-ACP dehydratase FabZ family protein [Chitinophaga sp. CF118]SFD76039.1 3-hydroxyacyl-[acyl-carrier-protein] dehydratase [Chitinophaga sp. CF118]
MTKEEVLECLPYGPSFLFVDALDHIDNEGATGHYTFHPEMECYKGHFIKYPVTPGVLLTEVMAQIGLVCLGIYITADMETCKGRSFALTSSEVHFRLPVFPGEKVTVISEKVYFRFGKLKCKVKLNNSEGKEVCSGIISGMIITRPTNA